MSDIHPPAVEEHKQASLGFDTLTARSTPPFELGLVAYDGSVFMEIYQGAN